MEGVFSMAGAIANLTTIIGGVIDIIEAHDVLMVCMVAPVVGIGISMVRKLVGRM